MPAAPANQSLQSLQLLQSGRDGASLSSLPISESEDDTQSMCLVLLLILFNNYNTNNNVITYNNCTICLALKRSRVIFTQQFHDNLNLLCLQCFITATNSSYPLIINQIFLYSFHFWGSSLLSSVFSSVVGACNCSRNSTEASVQVPCHNWWSYNANLFLG